MPALLPLRRPSASLALLLTAALLFALAGCDSGGPADDAAAPGAPSAQGAPGSDTLTLRTTPAPAGAALFAEGNRSSAASPYGCSLSTLRSAADVAAGKAPYRSGGVYLHFSEALVGQAAASGPGGGAEESQSSGPPVQHVQFVMVSRRAPAHAQAGPGGSDESGGVVRRAHCRLPAGSDNSSFGEQIRQRARKKLERFSPKHSWIGEDAPSGPSPSAVVVGGCVEYTYVFICDEPNPPDPFTDPGCTFVDKYCSDYKTEIIIPQIDPGGGGGNGDPDECDGGDDDDGDDTPEDSIETELRIGGGKSAGGCGEDDINSMTPQQLLDMVAALDWPVNPEERSLCLNNPVECTLWAKAVVFAITASKSILAQTDQPVDSSPANAVKHAFWNALMAMAMGEARAEVWADAHETGLGNAEEGDPNVDPGTKMDYYNNQQGRDVGILYYPGSLDFYAPTIVAIIKAMRDGGDLRNWACGPWPGTGTHHPGGDGQCGTGDDFWP